MEAASPSSNLQQQFKYQREIESVINNCMQREREQESLTSLNVSVQRIKSEMNTKYDTMQRYIDERFDETNENFGARVKNLEKKIVIDTGYVNVHWMPNGEARLYNYNPEKVRHLIGKHFENKKNLEATYYIIINIPPVEKQPDYPIIINVRIPDMNYLFAGLQAVLQYL